MSSFRLSLISLFFSFSCLSYASCIHAETKGCGNDKQSNQSCCGKLDQSRCRTKKGFVTLPSRTQTYFTGAPDCTSLEESVPSARIYYRIQGKFNPRKPTIVFIHGFGETSDIWRCAQDELCSTYCTVAMDLRGYGRSSKTPAVPEPNGIHYTVDLSTEDVFELLNGLGINKNIVLVGHSIAASYALKYNSLHPEQLLKLVLIGGPPFVVPNCAVDQDCLITCKNPFTCETGFCWPFGITVDAANAIGAPLVNCLNSGGSEKECLRSWGEFIAPIWFNEPCQEQLKGAQGSLVSSVVSNTPAIINNIFFVAAAEDVSGFIPDVKIPTLICYGSIDAVVNPGTQKFYHENIPNSVLVEFVGKGHELHVTDYKNFNRLLSEFISSCKFPDFIKVFDEGCCICPKLKPVCFDE